VSTPWVVTQMLAESGLSDDPGLTRILSDLHALTETPAPAPGPGLAELLGPDEAGAGRAVVVPKLRRRVVGGATALALGAVTATGVAAAANELPSGAQRVVAKISERFLPFDFPAPVAEPGHVPAESADAGARDDVPGQPAPVSNPDTMSPAAESSTAEVPAGRTAVQAPRQDGPAAQHQDDHHGGTGARHETPRDDGEHAEHAEDTIDTTRGSRGTDDSGGAEDGDRTQTSGTGPSGRSDDGGDGGDDGDGDRSGATTQPGDGDRADDEPSAGASTTSGDRADRGSGDGEHDEG
jgi:hypothetical protein